MEDFFHYGKHSQLTEWIHFSIVKIGFSIGLPGCLGSGVITDEIRGLLLWLRLWFTAVVYCCGSLLWLLRGFS